MSERPRDAADRPPGTDARRPDADDRRPDAGDPLDAKAIVDLLTDRSPDARAAWFDAHPEAAPLRARVERVLANVDRIVADADALPDLVGDAREGPADGSLPESIGPYRVLRRLGAGGMGVVYLAEQIEPRRRVAVKVLRGGPLAEEVAARFEREAELLGRLQHPGIAQVIELGRLDSGETYLVMEAIDGAPLTAFARDAGLDLEGRVELIVDLADAVHHAHLRGVVHRDLKPSNVLVTADGQVKVIDFGVARALDDGETLLTRTGQLVGTLAYMSPEQVAGDITAIDARADVYALGVMAYELLGGRLPLDLDTTNIARAARTIAEVDPPALGRVVPECRGDLEIIVGKALEKEPDQRFPSAAELGADLSRTLRHEAILSRKPTLTYQLGRLARRHRTAFAAAALAIVSLIAATVVSASYAITNRRLAASEASAREEADVRADEARRAAEEADRQRREVARLAAVAEERAAEIIRRADPARLLLAQQEADALWPALPETVPAMDAWIARYVDTFEENLGVHEAALGELRAGARPYSEEQRRLDREQHPRRAELEETRSIIENIRSRLEGEDPLFGRVEGELRAAQERALAEYEQRLVLLEEVVAERTTWEFDDPVVQEQHDHLARLVGDLRSFFDPVIGLAAEVGSRRERAFDVVARTVTDPEPAEEWRHALADIASLDVYEGLEIPPQVGLRPLRRDPRSGLWEFWLVDTGAAPEPRHDDPGWSIDGDTGLVFVLVPGGRTTVGAQSHDPSSPRFDPAAQIGEGPVRVVELPPLLVSKYELTQGQYHFFTGEAPSQYASFAWFGSPPGDEPISVGTRWNPVEMIPFADTDALLRKLGMRIPTGEEWEHAARGGADTRWHTGADVASLQGVANVADGRVQRLGGPIEWTYDFELADDWVIHAPVGSFAPNPFGLHDVHGNVYEWTSDEPERGIAVARGGCYERPALAARITAREYGSRNGVSRFVGVRPVRDVERR